MWKLFALATAIGLAAFLVPRRVLASTTAQGEPPVTIDPKDTRPRGIRNNNPTNIEDSSIPWRGRIGNDGRYVVFDTAINGLRAGYLEIWDSIVRDGDDTIRTLIRQWAPPIENLTGAYQNSVRAQTGIANIDTKLNYLRDATPLLKAIVQHENGQQPYTSQQYDAAFRAAGKL
jgi:hypothetical protein